MRNRFKAPLACSLPWSAAFRYQFATRFPSFGTPLPNSNIAPGLNWAIGTDHRTAPDRNGFTNGSND